jgi:hypothetical protein
MSRTCYTYVPGLAPDDKLIFFVLDRGQIFVRDCSSVGKSFLCSTGWYKNSKSPCKSSTVVSFICLKCTSCVEGVPSSQVREASLTSELKRNNSRIAAMYIVLSPCRASFVVGLPGPVLFAEWKREFSSLSSLGWGGFCLPGPSFDVGTLFGPPRLLWLCVYVGTGFLLSTLPGPSFLLWVSFSALWWSPGFW